MLPSIFTVFDERNEKICLVVLRTNAAINCDVVPYLEGETLQQGMILVRLLRHIRSEHSTHIFKIPNTLRMNLQSPLE